MLCTLRFDVSGPLRGCQHSPKLRTWHSLAFFRCPLAWSNYGTVYRGKRLWIYTSIGAFHFDASWVHNVLADRREPIGEASSPKGDGRAAG